MKICDGSGKSFIRSSSRITSGVKLPGMSSRTVSRAAKAITNTTKYTKLSMATLSRLTSAHQRRFSSNARIEALTTSIDSSGIYTYPPDSKLINSRHFYQNTVLMDWVKKLPRPISLRQLAFFGRNLNEQKILASANFAREELPIRLAHRIRDMQLLPFAVTSNPHMCHVYQQYYRAFDRFRKFPVISNLQDNDRFCALLTTLLEEHLDVIPNVVIGAIECSQSNSIQGERLDTFMSSVLRSRISRRVIAEQHLSLSNIFREFGTSSASQRDPDYIGEVFLQCSAMEAVKKCSEHAKSLSRELYPDAVLPEVVIEGHTDTRFPYMQTHLEYIIGEILRNSMEATIKKHYVSTSETVDKATGKKIFPPPILVSISNTNQNVMIRFSDQGGGIPAEVLPNIWSFAKKGPRSDRTLQNFKLVPILAGTSQEVATHREMTQKQEKNAMEEEMEIMPGFDLHDKQFQSSLGSLAARSPKLKLGMGLPLSRVYAEYWDGALDLHSLEGYGCDMFLRISRLGNQSERIQLDKV